MARAGELFPVRYRDNSRVPFNLLYRRLWVRGLPRQVERQIILHPAACHDDPAGGDHGSFVPDVFKGKAP